MNKGQLIFGIVLFALATASLYIWGLRKSVAQAYDLNRILLGKCARRLLRYLKNNDTIDSAEAARQIAGLRAGEFWSRKRVAVREPEAFAPQVLDYLLAQLYIEPTDTGRYRLKK